MFDNDKMKGGNVNQLLVDILDTFYSFYCDNFLFFFWVLSALNLKLDYNKNTE